MRMTKGMLDAIMTALCELEASGNPQGVTDPKEKERILYNVSKAQFWVEEQVTKRKEEYQKRKRSRINKQT